jgi:hypothetical protein
MCTHRYEKSRICSCIDIMGSDTWSVIGPGHVSCIIGVSIDQDQGGGGMGILNLGLGGSGWRPKKKF